MILDSSTQWSNRSCSQVSNSLTPSPAQVWIKRSQERPSNNILGARVLKELICWNGSKDPQIELWLERTPAQNWTNNYQHLWPKSIWHKVKLLPPDVFWISFSCSQGDSPSKVRTIQRESQPSHKIIYCTDLGTMGWNPAQSSSFQIFISLFKTIAALDYLYRSFNSKDKAKSIWTC